jgi:tRNA (guanine26-N2/guanine27-N2)-dimethyltransferase
MVRDTAQKNRDAVYREGAAAIAAGKAFLNPESRFSRDVSIAFASLVANKETSILDATAATGIRGIRYYLETKSRDITMLDMNRDAYLSAKRNAASNGAAARIFNKSIQQFCNTTRERFSIVDYDPFGGVAPTLFDLFKVVKDNGYLMLTATDTAVLCGAHENACLRYYDSKPMHNELCYEVGLRILVGYSARTASQFNFGIEPVVSFSYKHYMRSILRLRHGAESAKQSIKDMGHASMCNRCGYRSTEKGPVASATVCPNCSSELATAGKLWLGQLNDKPIIRKMLSKKRNTFEKDGIKLLETIINEADATLYYSIPRMSKRLGLPSSSPFKVMERLRSNGFTATRTHYDPDAVKTDAPIEEVMRAVSKSQNQGL